MKIKMTFKKHYIHFIHRLVKVIIFMQLLKGLVQINIYFFYLTMYIV